MNYVVGFMSGRSWGWVCAIPVELALPVSTLSCIAARGWGSARCSSARQERLKDDVSDDVYLPLGNGCSDSPAHTAPAVLESLQT